MVKRGQRGEEARGNEQNPSAVLADNIFLNRHMQLDVTSRSRRVWKR